jgi:hypothetical protein
VQKSTVKDKLERSNQIYIYIFNQDMTTVIKVKSNIKHFDITINIAVHFLQ